MSLVSKILDSKANRVWGVTGMPASEPLTAAQVKLFGRIDGSTEDSLIDDFIKAVREATELYLGRSLLEQTISMYIDYWPDSSFIELPMPPLLSVNSVALLNQSNSATAYDSANYFLVSAAARLVIRNDCTPPVNDDRDNAGIRIEYKAGYGSTANYIPSPIINAMKLWAVACYEDRAQTSEPPPSAKSLLNMYRVIKI
jgi:uncharacterized phiE125 gp8 family phage protein